VEAGSSPCYVTYWQLPQLDSHRLADDSFRGTSASCQAANQSYAYRDSGKIPLNDWSQQLHEAIRKESLG
jgi:hypothetical protein